MTGFGSAEDRVLRGRLRVEIRTVNHRYFNPQLKLPADLAGVEGELRERLRQLLERGHVAVTARWVEGAPDEVLKFRDANRGQMAEDRDGAPVFLAKSAWELGYVGGKFPNIKFLKTRERSHAEAA